MSRQALELALDALTYIHTETSVDEDELIDKAITAIKEALAQPEQEPVAIGWYIEGYASLLGAVRPNLRYEEWRPFYAMRIPPQRKPLTEWQMCNIAEQCGCMSADWIDFARAIEAAHGIKE